MNFQPFFSFFLSDIFFTLMSVEVSIYETYAMIERSHKIVIDKFEKKKKNTKTGQMQ